MKSLTIVVFCCLLALPLKAQVEAPVIFNSSETIRPGEAFGLQGHHFGAQPQVWFSVVRGDEEVLKPSRQAEVISKSDINVSAILPTSVPANCVVAVWLKNGKTWSQPVFLNRARAVTIEFNELMPGQAFRIFGRNLKAGNGVPIVQFITTGKAPLIAKCNKGDAYTLELVAPKLQAGQHYRVTVSNGMAGKWGRTISDERILARPASVDPFDLKTAWGTAFTFYKNIYNVRTDPRLRLKAAGDGKANDRKALQEAIDRAHQDGGGVVYLPAGNYKLDFNSGAGLILRSRVVLKGDGFKQTRIQYGFGTPPPYDNPIGKSGWPDSTINGVAILWPLNTTLTGLYRLELQNVNTSGAWKHSLKNMPPPEKKPGAGGSRFFVAECRFDLAVAWGLTWGHVDRFIIRDSEFESHARNTWPWQWHCNGATNFSVRHNSVKYAAGRFGFSDSDHGVLEYNHFIRLGDEQMIKGESGGFNIDYAADIVVLANHMEVQGRNIDPIVNNNQGETILSQGGNPDNQDAGSVAAATANSVTVAGKNWRYPIRKASLSASDAVAIVAGRGAGQWRYIKENNTNTLQVTKPWTVIPDRTSYCVIMRWSAKDWLVKDNSLEGNNRGIWFYCGDHDVAIVDNQLTNSDGIYVRSDQRITDQLGRFNLSWNTLIENNRVVDKNGLRPAYVSATLALMAPYDLKGIGTIGLEVRRNYVEAHTPNAASFIQGEGCWNSLSSKNPAVNNQPGILGSIFEGNEIRNADIAYRLSANSTQTIIKGAINKSVKNFSSDELNLAKPSDQTVVIK